MQSFKEYLINALKSGTDGNVNAGLDYGNCDDDVLEIEDVDEIERMMGCFTEDRSEDEDDEMETSEAGNESRNGIENRDSETNNEKGDQEKIIHFRQWVSTDRCEFKEFA